MREIYTVLCRGDKHYRQVTLTGVSLDGRKSFTTSKGNIVYEDNLTIINRIQ